MVCSYFYQGNSDRLAFYLNLPQITAPPPTIETGITRQNRGTLGVAQVSKEKTVTWKLANEAEHPAAAQFVRQTDKLNVTYVLLKKFCTDNCFQLKLSNRYVTLSFYLPFYLWRFL